MTPNGHIEPLVLAVIARSLSREGRLEVIEYLLRFEAESATFAAWPRAVMTGE